MPLNCSGDRLTKTTEADFLCKSLALVLRPPGCYRGKAKYAEFPKDSATLGRVWFWVNEKEWTSFKRADANVEEYYILQINENIQCMSQRVIPGMTLVVTKFNGILLAFSDIKAQNKSSSINVI